MPVLMYRYLLTMAVAWRLHGGCMAKVPRKSDCAVRASWYLHRVSITNCKLKVLLYHHTVAQLLSYCSRGEEGISTAWFVTHTHVRCHDQFRNTFEISNLNDWRQWHLVYCFFATNIYVQLNIRTRFKSVYEYHSWYWYLHIPALLYDLNVNKNVKVLRTRRTSRVCIYYKANTALQ